MKGVLLLVCCCVLAVAASVATAQSARPPLRVVVKQCRTGATPADRSATFEASMPRHKGAVTMAMRFRLYEKAGDGRFERVRVPGFSDWKRSAPNVAGLVFSKRVEQLSSDARYRVTVNYAWYDSTGDVVGRKQRTSKACVQPA